MNELVYNDGEATETVALRVKCPCGGNWYEPMVDYKYLQNLQCPTCHRPLRVRRIYYRNGAQLGEPLATVSR